MTSTKNLDILQTLKKKRYMHTTKKMQLHDWIFMHSLYISLLTLGPKEYGLRPN